MRAAVLGLLALVLAATAQPAGAFVLIKIREMFPGSTAHPTALYVMLQLIGDGQGDVTSHPITFYDATGTPLPGFTFPSDVTNDVNQATILVGTTDVASAFGVTPDFPTTPTFVASGGKICFDIIDCVSWGNYTGDTAGVCSNGQPLVCTPAASSGIPDGKAIRRRIDRGNTGLLDFADDTGVGADDFEVVDPNPIPNSIVPTTTTTTTPGSGPTTTTTTTLPCALPGLDGARCVLAQLPPASCAGVKFPKKIPRLVASGDDLLARAQSTTVDRQVARLLKKAAAKLAKASRLVTKAGNTGKLPPICATDLGGIVEAARDRLATIVPTS
ncbi:MAG TPA: hypothetical protein VMS22_15415 [Candidatus Eisenbacteria bacterium]|nr:hypothetical protein [Candidatus Eisenbacteria bacterium]